MLAMLAFLAAAADMNGYTAQYECRAGNPRCDVDVVGLTAQPCQEVITSADDETTIEGKINGGARFICVQPGSYIDRGVIDVTASGTATARKVLRYARAGDTDDEPWRQAPAARAEFRKLRLAGSFWIIHRLTFPATSSFVADGFRIGVAGADDHIFSRLLIEGRPSPGEPYYGAMGVDWPFDEHHRSTVQNSVIRNNWGQTGSNCVGLGGNGSDHRIVNNEIYDWCEHAIQLGNNNIPATPGYIIENNDVYGTAAFDGYSEDLTVQKSSGTVSNPVRWLHNRLGRNRWGTRTAEGGGGTGLHLADQQADGSNTAAWTLVQDNVFFDQENGVAGYAYQKHHVSVIGNLFFSIRDFSGRSGNSAAISVGMSSSSEVYLNTVVSADASLNFGYGGNDNDVRCNVAFDTGVQELPASRDVVRSNVTYNAAALGTDDLAHAVSVRSSATSFPSGAVLRLTANVADCTAPDDADCFLWLVRTAGVSASAPPTYCARPGCTQSDGTMTLQAIRGPYCFYRALLTTPARVCVPYATAYDSAPEYGHCRQELVGAALGSRAGTGIDDTTAPW